jgi:hypothetical protein
MVDKLNGSLAGGKFHPLPNSQKSLRFHCYNIF